MKQDKDRDNDVWLVVYLMIPIVMIVLKALGLIDLSWLWILSPLWVPVGLTVIVAALILVGLIILSAAALIVTLIEKIKGN